VKQNASYHTIQPCLPYVTAAAIIISSIHNYVINKYIKLSTIIISLSISLMFEAKQKFNLLFFLKLKQPCLN
jgi:hypothetical protein